MGGLKTGKDNENIGNRLKTGSKTQNTAETEKKKSNTVNGIKTGNKNSVSSNNKDEVKGVIHTLAKTSKRVIQTGSSTIKTTSKVAESKDGIEAIKTGIEGYGKATKGVIRTGKKVVGKATDKVIKKYGSEKSQKRWGTMKKVGTNAGKGYKKLKNTNSAIKTLATQASKEDGFEATTGYAKTILNYSTKPARKAIKKGLKKLGKETAKLIAKAIRGLFQLAIKFVAWCWPFLIAVLIVCICYVSLTSVFGGLMSGDSKATEEQYQEVIDKTEAVFQKLEDKKVAELKSYTDAEKAKVGKGKAPSKSTFEGISDEDYKELIDNKWKQDQFVEESISFIDYKALAVISQHFLENDDKGLQKFIDKLDSKGLIEEYSTRSQEIEYEVKWVKWTEHKVTAKTRAEVVTKAYEYKGKHVEYGEPIEVSKNKWEMTAKTGEERSKKLKYTQYTVVIENGTYSQFVDEIDYTGVDKEDKETLKALMQATYDNEYFMSVFAKNWDKAGGTATAGGKYVAGIPHGNLFNWKGSVNDFKNTAFTGSLVGQCTWFAGGRWAQTHNEYCPMTGNAGQWFAQAQQAGLSIGKAPKPHSVLVLGGGSVPGYEGCGHVAFVEEVKMENGEITSITISQGNMTAPSQEAVIRNPMAYTDVRTYKSIDEYMAMWGSGLYVIGFVY